MNGDDATTQALGIALATRDLTRLKKRLDPRPIRGREPLEAHVVSEHARSLAGR
jgi:hypothetical protein